MAAAAPSHDALVKQAKETAKSIEKLNGMLLQLSVDRPPREVIEAVLVHTCLLTKIIAPDARQKLDEFLYAAQNDNYRVNPNQHGADLIEKTTGSATELKVATCILNPPATVTKSGAMKRPTVKASVMWPVPKYDSKGDQQKRRNKMLESVKRKTNSGGAVIRVVNGMQKVLKEYHLSHKFLMAYFERADLGTSTAYNMGAPMCKHCKSFHRLDRLQAYSDKIDLSADGTLSVADWKCVFNSDSKTKCPAAAKEKAGKDKQQ